MPDHSRIILTVLLLIAVWALMDRLGVVIAAGALGRWAKKRGFTIVSKRRRNLLTGPFFGWNNPVFYITVRHKDGRQQDGLASIRGSHVDVHWVYKDLEGFVA